jgi:hypothetical protein
VHNTLGIAGGAGGKQNLEGSVCAETRDRAGLRGGKYRLPFFKCQALEVAPRIISAQLTNQQRIANGEPGPDIGRNTGSEVGAAESIKRHSQDAAQNAAMECGDPLGAVLGPQNDAIAGANALVREECGEASGLARNFSIVLI